MRGRGKRREEERELREGMGNAAKEEREGRNAAKA